MKLEDCKKVYAEIKHFLTKKDLVDEDASVASDFLAYERDIYENIKNQYEFLEKHLKTRGVEPCMIIRTQEKLKQAEKDLEEAKTNYYDKEKRAFRFELKNYLKLADIFKNSDVYSKVIDTYLSRGDANVIKNLNCIDEQINSLLFGVLEAIQANDFVNKDNIDSLLNLSEYLYHVLCKYEDNFNVLGEERNIKNSKKSLKFYKNQISVNRNTQRGAVPIIDISQCDREYAEKIIYSFPKDVEIVQ